MEEKTFILKENSEEIRQKIKDARILLCVCAEFVDSDWIYYNTLASNGVHGNGYPYKGMTKEETRAIFLYGVRNSVFCNDVDEFIRRIKEFEYGKVK